MKMRLNVSHRIVCSLLTSAMLSSSAARVVTNGGAILASPIAAAADGPALDLTLGGLSSGGWAVPKGYEKPQIPAVQGRAITASIRSSDDPMQRVAAKAVAHNDYGDLNAAVNAALGLNSFPSYQLEVAVGEDIHLFNVSRDGRVVLFSRIDRVVYYFLLDANGSPVAAAVKTQTRPHVAVTIDSVRPQLHQMLGFWMDWANRYAVANG